MSAEYHVRYKMGDTEIEVQSSDKEYVNGMLDKLLKVVPPEPEAPLAGRGSKAEHQRPRVQSDSAAHELEEETAVDAAKVSNKVHEADNYAQIEKNILNKRSVLARVLLAFHFAHECGFDELTSGDVAKITDALGVKILPPNASGCISNNRKFFSAGAARRQGAKILYKLNRQGEQAYNEALDAEKV